MLYTVGEMAKVMHIPASTLRYYDQEGLLPFVERSSGGIRMFSEKDYEWLKVIECLKSSGLSIKEIRAFIDMAARGDESIHERLELFQSRRAAVKKQMEDLLYEIHLTEGLTDVMIDDYISRQKKEILKKGVFAKYKITPEQFDSSLMWYGKNLELY